MHSTDSRPIKGVNLGGWLVLEKWITPSLFQNTRAVDEYTFCQQAGKTELARLKRFRDEFITKQDFEWLAAHGVEAVRLPVGYWAFGDAAPYQATVEYIDKAFAWAKATNIKMLVDLHGAPGSQNGWDHSGQKGSTQWHRLPNAVADTLTIVRRLAERYGSHPALLGFSLLNEPSPLIPKAQLLRYYERGYRIIREICGDDAWVVFGDGYLPFRWRDQLPLSKFPGTYHDTHQYRVFGPLDRLLPPRVTLLRTRWLLSRTIRWLSRHHPVIVGEWSLAMRHRADQATQQAYARVQLQAYQHTAAWFFWTYRTEDTGGWNFRDRVEQGMLRLNEDTDQT